MNKKYTFTELCELYNKIEIPIIQRDYAQGRSTPDVQIIRTRFIDDFLIPAIVEERQIELDFVYGTVLSEIKEEVKLKNLYTAGWAAKAYHLIPVVYSSSAKGKKISRCQGYTFKIHL